MVASLTYYRQTLTTLLVLLVLTLWPLSHAQAMLEQPEARTVDSADPSDVFPLPAALEPAVSFWSKVFAVWRRDQLALHDREYLGVVYRIAQFSGPITEGLTKAQRSWMLDQESQLASQLRRLASNKAAGRPLSAQEQTLFEAIHRGGGTLRGAADRVRSQRGTRERFLRGLQASGRYDRVFREVFRSQGLPEDLAYLPHVESSFQIGARSSVGAAGMWQFMPRTARSYMTVTASVDERLNPVTAAHGAARYFAGAYRQLGSWPLAVTSYNHGIGGMRRAQLQHGNDFARIVREYDAPSFGFASRNFYPEFLAVRRIAQDIDKYFPEGVRFQSPLAVKPLVLSRSTHAHDISKKTGARLATLADLNPGWSDHALTGKTKLPAGVTVWVPSGTKYASDLHLLPTTRIARGSSSQQRESSVGRQHKVAQGDNLWSIAKRYGTTVAALSVYNGLDAKKSHLRIGQKLELPPTGSSKAKQPSSIADTTTHRVGKGDTPFGIASSYKISLRDLLAANNMTSSSVIHPGQKLLIPSKP